MSDLISRSNLIMRLSDYALQESPNDNESTGEQRISKMIYDAIQNCISCVEEQPTAYSVDEVVEELKVIKEDALAEYNIGEYNLDNNIGNSIAENYRKDMNEGKCFAYDEAIEIVKQGGVGKESE